MLQKLLPILILMLPLQFFSVAASAEACASHHDRVGYNHSPDHHGQKADDSSFAHDIQLYSSPAGADDHHAGGVCDDCVGCVGCPAAVNTRSSQVFPLAHPSLGATPLVGFYSTSLPVEIRPPIAA